MTKVAWPLTSPRNTYVCPNLVVLRCKHSIRGLPFDKQGARVFTPPPSPEYNFLVRMKVLFSQNDSTHLFMYYQMYMRLLYHRTSSMIVCLWWHFVSHNIWNAITPLLFRLLSNLIQDWCEVSEATPKLHRLDKHPKGVREGTFVSPNPITCPIVLKLCTEIPFQ